jgi:hypothetical protein
MDHGLNDHCPKGLCSGDCPAKYYFTLMGSYYYPIQSKLEDSSKAPLGWALELDNIALVWIRTNFSQVENSVFNNFNKYVEKFPFF